MVNLTQEQLNALHGMESQLALIQSEINRMEDAGLDTTAIQRQYDEVKKLRAGLLRVYGGQISRRPIG